jgi:hypothetical protein
MRMLAVIPTDCSVRSIINRWLFLTRHRKKLSDQATWILEQIGGFAPPAPQRGQTSDGAVTERAGLSPYSNRAKVGHEVVPLTSG